MILTSWKTQCISVNAPPGTGNARQQWGRLQRLYLFVKDSKGNMGIGEASPLPGYSPETASDCLRALTRILPELCHTEVHTAADVQMATAHFPEGMPSARYALETALLDLLARSSGIPLWQLFTQRALPIHINGLLFPNHFEQTTHRLYQNGIRTFKLKMNGAGDLRQMRQILQSLRDTFGRDIHIRLDANGSIPPDKVVQTGLQLAPFAPEYIEEPTPFHLLPASALPVPLAFDESLINRSSFENMLAHPSCQAIILKPSLHGGFFNVRKMAETAMGASKDVIITHMFESLPGYLAAVHLAATLPIRRPCGLFPPASINLPSANQFFSIVNDCIQLTALPGLGVNSDVVTAETGDTPC